MEAATGKMMALVYDTYGMSDVLYVEEMEIPQARDHEILIRVYAASVNSWDWDLLRGKPFANRIGRPYKPRYRILGADVAGQVISVGAAVSKFQQGDRVFGDISGCGWGGFAEYVCAHEDALTLMPEDLEFEQAAAIPQAAVLALQGLRDQGKLAKDHHVLINGAGGGVGTFGIQYAKWLGAEVTGVDSMEKLDLLSRLGADHVLDYTRSDFTGNGQQYDVILDVIGNRSIFDIKKALRPGGTYVIIGGTTFRILEALAASPWIGWLEKKKVKLLIHKPNHDDQLVWKSLVETGRITPVIDRKYSLQEGAQALRYFGEGRMLGKVIITMKSDVH
ncbi:NAD(P)-dependent alcohol dehydrogenase [Paenibacillus wulumuqiensis]|uniref:NAD(P)-dependent alcohol dehydrogenase n=1 Tax=Paenibacillus wulumuqiensis TaxID=1567107 RepID=UPI0009E59D18|nr:NAD(P)-dependent alcohol dehydrogenase [Paenibacillus wulumuqiensis]